MKAIFKINFVYLLLLTLFSKEVFAQDSENGLSDVHFEIENVVYDNSKSIIYSDGGIKVYNDELEMTADYFELNSEEKVFSLVGDVEIDGQGNYFKVNNLVGSSDMGNAFGKSVEGFSSDGGYLKADSLAREDSADNVFRKVEFTACDIGLNVEDFKNCQDGRYDELNDKKETPAWSLYSGKLIQDTEADMLYAYNNIFYLWDFPIFYLPYIAYPSFDVKRKTGLLPFEIGSKNYGYYASTPLFINISDYEDLTLKPSFTQDEGVIAGLEYRKRLKSGEVFLDGYHIDEKSSGQKRWYVNSRNDFALSDIWKLDFDIRRASDDTFSKKYDITHDDWLTSNLEAGAYWDNNYFITSFTSYQDLRYYDNLAEVEETPEVVPEMFFYYKTEVENGSFWEFDWSVVNLWTDRNASDGVVDSYNSRASFDLTKNYNNVFSNGIIADTSFSLKNDFYSMRDVYYGDVDPLETPENNNELRVVPELNIMLKYPLFKKAEGFSSILEPVFQAIISSDNVSLNNNKIVNIDSLDTELDENNLFASNRFRGRDVIETGNRFNAGVNWDIMFDDTDKYLSMFLGQGFIDSSNEYYPQDSGLRNEFTDAIGAIKFHYSSDFALYYRFRLDGENYTANRNDLGARYSQDTYWIDFGYIYSSFVDETSSLDTESTEETRVNFKTKISDRWNALVGVVYNLSTDSVSEWEAGTEFVNDCLGLAFIASKRNANDRDYEGSTSFSFKITFRSLDGNKSREALEMNDYFDKEGKSYD